MHLREESYACDICDKHYPRIQSLSRHMMYIHDRMRPMCELCNKTFSEPKVLRNHIERIHEKKKHHQCTSCEKTFFDKNDLNCHFEGVHIAAKNYECNICGKCFNSKRNLSGHSTKFHSLEKPLQKVCEQCNKIFQEVMTQNMMSSEFKHYSVVILKLFIIDVRKYFILFTI